MKEIPMEEWVNRFSRHISDQVLQVIEAKRKDRGELLGTALFYSTLQLLIASEVYRTLSADMPEGVTPKQKEDTVIDNFKITKELMEAAVSGAFKGAMEAWGGGEEDFDYFCKIQYCPPPINKDAC